MPNGNAGAPGYRTQLPFNPEPAPVCLPGRLVIPSHLRLFPHMLFLHLSLKATLRRKQLSVITKWVRSGSASLLFQLIPKGPSPGSLNTIHPKWHLSGGKKKETAALEANFTNSYPTGEEARSFLCPENGKLHFRKTECLRNKGNAGQHG